MWEAGPKFFGRGSSDSPTAEALVMRCMEPVISQSELSAQSTTPRRIRGEKRATSRSCVRRPARRAAELPSCSLPSQTCPPSKTSHHKFTTASELRAVRTVHEHEHEPSAAA